MQYSPHLKTILSQAYILGGSPCSGKSTLAEKLCARFDLQYYKVDDHYQDHIRRANPQQHPTMHKLAQMSWNETWSRPVDIQVREECQFYRELFEMILQDLEKFSAARPVLLEGAAFLPELVAKVRPHPQRVLYMLPTKKFQVDHYARRPFIQNILKECDDPESAFANWMERDHLFGQEILKQAQNYGYGSIIVDGSRSVEDELKFASQYFGLV
jgi:2-phosphoglycerate kinase